MIRKIKKNIRSVERGIDELPLERQGNLFSAVLSVIAVIAIARVALL